YLYFESCHGPAKASSTGYTAARGPAVRCVESSRLLRHFERTGAERNPIARFGAICGSPADCQRAWRISSTTIRRQVSPDSDLCRSSETGSACPEPDGCSPVGQPCQ